MKRNVAIFFGGYSAEHDVSIMSAHNVAEAIDRSLYAVSFIGFNRKHQPYYFESLNSLKSEELFASGRQLTRAELAQYLIEEIDVVFPVLHGPGGEDGKLQGFLQTLDIPFVGADVTASALCMDKRLAKCVMASAGLPIVPWLAISHSQYRGDKAALVGQIESALSYPVFVKPANLGSSIGVGKVKQRSQLLAAIELALSYDEYALVEQGIEPRELECAVYGNDVPVALAVGEIIPSHEIYDYEAKYSDGEPSELLIPANIDAATMQQIKTLTLEVYKLFNIKGMARVDFLVDKVSGDIYISEINTLPGFTEHSMFPLLSQAAGLSYRQIVSELIELAIERFANERNYTAR